MNTKEWLESTDPQQMLAAIAERASTRKLRWFGCGCCRRVWQHLEDSRSRAAIEAAERYADGEVAKDILSAAHSGADRAARQGPTSLEASTTAEKLQAWAAAAARYASQSTDRIPALSQVVGYAANYALLADGCGSHDTPKSREYQCMLLRDIFGNPFHLALFSSAWRTDTAVSLAQQMYDSRDFGAMPILADALQDAGCDNGDILDH